MVSHPRIPVERVVPTRSFSPTEVDAILEVAYLAIASDGKLDDDELDAFGRVAATLLHASSQAHAVPGDDAATLSPDELNRLLDRFYDLRDREGAPKRLTVAAGRLPTREARGAAYKIACALALADLASSDREFEFDLDLIATLELSQSEADRLAADVHAAVAEPAD